jgi:hypothetical protein
MFFFPEFLDHLFQGGYLTPYVTAFVGGISWNLGTEIESVILGSDTSLDQKSVNRVKQNFT